MSANSQSNLLYAWYGDDFTGSTDVLEGLALSGIPAVLFTGVPREADLQTFAECRAIGIGGESRSRPPSWMDANLPTFFEAMRAMRAPISHYKVCSTFDSSPGTGNIGRAMELGLQAFHSEFVPVVVGAPRLERSVVFGNLFAAAQGRWHRIDRHPAMSRHPVTPMKESDLRLHLAKQTRLPLALVDLPAFQAGTAGERLQSELTAGARAVIFDGIDDAMLETTAALLWERGLQHPMFAVGSSGLTYGLIQHWRRIGCMAENPALNPARPADRLLVLSGSCSPATEKQIRFSIREGFAPYLLAGREPPTAAMEQARLALASGKSVVLYTAPGSEPEKDRYDDKFWAATGRQLRTLLLETGVRRVLIAGGDTATHVVGQLGISALTFAAPLVPGAPLCRSYAPGSPLDGLELVLKGGQIGPEHFFSQVRDGKMERSG